MKTSSSAALKFPGNPLRVIEDNVSYSLLATYLQIVRPEDEIQRHSDTSEQVKDPGSWDAAWFANYE